MGTSFYPFGLQLLSDMDIFHPEIEFDGGFF